MILSLLFPATVTIALPADNAARLLPKLGGALGLRLEADARAGRQVLLVHVRNMERDRLLALVAKSTGGAWEKVEGGYRLTIGSLELQRLRQEETAARKGWIDAVLGATGAPAEAEPALQAARLVGAGRIAAVAPGVRAVWSTEPTRLQGSLPKAALAAARGVFAGDDGQTRRPSAAMLIVYRDLHAPQAQLCLVGYDRKGDIASLSMPFLTAPSAGGPPELEARLPDAPMVFGEEARAVGQSLGDFSPLPDATQARMTHPEANEPLALVAGAAVDAVGAAAGMDVVACLPDRAALAFSEPLIKPLKAKAWPGLLRSVGIALGIDGNVLLGTMVDRAQGVEDRADRARLRERIATYESEGNLTSRFPAPTGLEGDLLKLLGTNVQMDLLEGRMRLQPVWSLLNPGQRRQALNGGVALPPAAVAVLRTTMETPTEMLVVAGTLETEPTVLFARLQGPVFMKASSSPEPYVVMRRPKDRFPSTNTLQGVADALAGAPDGEGFRDLAAWYAPSTRTTLQASAALGPTLYDLRLEESRREGAATRPPNLYPALRVAVESRRRSRLSP